MLANFFGSFNVLFAPLVMLVLIVIEYTRGYVDDQLRRKLYMLAVIPTFLALSSDMLYDIFEGVPGEAAHVVAYLSCFLYYLWQVFAYHAIILFVDYQINKNTDRTKKFFLLVSGINIAHVIVLLLNIRYSFYFVVTPDNYYVAGDYYIIRLFFSYLPAVFAFANVYISRKNVHKDQVGLILFFIALTSIGSTIDLLLPEAKLVWPCFCSALLFSYFFIIRAESQIDALTGVNNRRSFESYLVNIAAPSKRKDYAFIMIDMNQFKQINDVHGHVEGDRALRDAANLIRGCLRKNDFVARYGGDEFFVISQTTTAELLVARLYKCFERFNETKTRPYALNVSIGYDAYPATSEVPPRDFVAHVDSLMYSAKKGGEERRVTSEKQ